MGKRTENAVRTFSVVLVAFLLGLALFCDVYAEDSAPDFTFIDIDGKEFATADFRGTTVVLSFVATRVVFCKIQVCILVNLSKYLQDDVVIVLIGASENALGIGGDTDEELQKFREECDFEGIVAGDKRGITENYNVTYVPTVFIIDQIGYIRYKHVGVASAGEQVLLGELRAIVPEFSQPLILLSIIVFVTPVIILLSRNGKTLCQNATLNRS